jgi:hypothetical protein
VPRHDRPSQRDYESLRGFVPARRRDPQLTEPDSSAADDRRVSVMEWLLAVGTVIVRKVKPVPPPSPVVRLHARR